MQKLQHIIRPETGQLIMSTNLSRQMRCLPDYDQATPLHYFAATSFPFFSTSYRRRHLFLQAMGCRHIILHRHCCIASYHRIYVSTKTNKDVSGSKEFLIIPAGTFCHSNSLPTNSFNIKIKRQKNLRGYFDNIFLNYFLLKIHWTLEQYNKIGRRIFLLTKYFTKKTKYIQKIGVYICNFCNYLEIFCNYLENVIIWKSLPQPSFIGTQILSTYAMHLDQFNFLTCRAKIQYPKNI